MNDITFCDQNYHILRIRNWTLVLTIVRSSASIQWVEKYYVHISFNNMYLNNAQMCGVIPMWIIK